MSLSEDPFAKFWSGQIADTSGSNKKRHRWLIRKPERRHSVHFEEPHKERNLLLRPRFYSRYPDSKSVSFAHVNFLLNHIIQQRLREQAEEKQEQEKGERELRRKSEPPTDLTGKPRRVIPVDPKFSPFDIKEDKDLIPGDTPKPSPESTSGETPSPTESPETPSSPLTPRLPIPHRKSTSSSDSVSSGLDLTMTLTTDDLVKALTKTLRNINQSPTIPLQEERRPRRPYFESRRLF